MAQLKPIDGTDVYLWKYLPSISIALVFIALFAAITSALCFRMFKTRSWFCIAFAIGGFFQIIGYGVRVLSHCYTNQIGPYVVQSTSIVLAPVFYSASIYMVLGRVIRSVQGDRFSVVRPSRLTKLFVLGDLIALSVQGNAAGLTAKKSTQKLGQYIIIAGLFIQLIMFGFFLIAAIVFHKRMRRDGAKESKARPDIPWSQGLKMIYACSVLIIIRSIFRIVEYMSGVNGYLLSHEWPMYVFDAVLMFAVQVIFLVWFPDKFKISERDILEDGHMLVDNERPMI